MTKSVPLENAAIRNFVARGCLDIPTDLPPSYHCGIRAALEEHLRRGADIENHVLWRLPELHQVFDHAAVRAALTAILGPDYIVNPHTYCHVSRPGSRGHAWHKDSYVVDYNTRHARPRWLMALYSPHDLSEALGPTAVIPRWQYHDSLDDLDDPAAPRSLISAAGTVTLLHADTWHGASANRSDHNRFLVKLLFERRREPWRPADERQTVAWCPDDDDLVPLLSMDVWRWLRGERPMPFVEPEPPQGNNDGDNDGGDDDVGDDDVGLLMQVLEHSPSETSRLRAAYGLSRMGPRAVAPLAALLRRQAIAAAEAGAMRGASNPKGINPTALPAAEALSAMNEDAVSALVALARDPALPVQLVAADTLGNIGPWVLEAPETAAEAAEEAVAVLAALAQHAASWQLRRNAVEALGRIGSSGSSDGAEGQALCGALSDSDVRVRLNAAMALGRVRIPLGDAVAALQRAREQDDNVYVRYYADAALAGPNDNDSDNDNDNDANGDATHSRSERAPVRRAWRAISRNQLLSSKSPAR